MSPRILNLDGLQPLDLSTMRGGAPARYRDVRIAPVSAKLGAQQLGYNLTVVAPGSVAFPFHNHHGIEEMFYILDGQGEVRLGAERHPIRAGDVIACPAGGPDTAHQILNTGTEALRYLAVSTTTSPDLVEYPDSGKIGAGHVLGRDERGLPKAVRVLNRAADNLDYWDGET